MIVYDCICVPIPDVHINEYTCIYKEYADVYVYAISVHYFSGRAGLRTGPPAGSKRCQAYRSIPPREGSCDAQHGGESLALLGVPRRVLPAPASSWHVLAACAPT